jgi:hypothetical protein
MLFPACIFVSTQNVRLEIAALQALKRHGTVNILKVVYIFSVLLVIASDWVAFVFAIGHQFNNIYNGAASARTSEPGASIGRCDYHHIMLPSVVGLKLEKNSHRNICSCCTQHRHTKSFI